MIKSNFSKQKRIPNITTKKSAPVTTNFAKGVSTYKPNDTMGLDELVLAENARFDRIGEYKTRLGQTHLNYVPIGQENYKNSYLTDSDNYVNGDRVQSWTFTVSTRVILSAVTIKIYKNPDYQDEYIVPKLVISDAATGEEIASSCFSPKNLSDEGELNTRTFIFQDAPELKSSSRATISLTTQTGNLAHLKVGVASLISSTIWASAKSAPQGKVTGIFEANIDGANNGSDGKSNPVFFAFKDATSGTTSLYWINHNRNVTKIRDLPSGAGRVRFCQNLDTIRYVDGAEAPHLLTPTLDTYGYITSWADTAITPTDLETGTTLNITMSNIMAGPNDNILYFATDPNTEVLWTYPYGYEYAKSPSFTTTGTVEGAIGSYHSVAPSTITPSGIAIGDWITGQGTGTGEVTSVSASEVWFRIVDTTPQTISSYDKFSTTFYQNFPAIKTGDPLTAMFNLGGVIFVQTRRHKYQMYTQTAESWSQSVSNAQGGTFSQESVVCDLNYAYYANDNGVYVFDGSSEASLTEGTIQNLYDAIQNKESIVLELYQNRLYVFYQNKARTVAERGDNDSCLVYNINLKIWESIDTNTFVSAACSRENASGRFLCGHSRLGQIKIHEKSQNNSYSDLGQAIGFNLETAYQHYGTTSQLKRITKWRPEFAVADAPYTCECGYALDFTDKVKYAFSIDLERNLPVFTDYEWDNPGTFNIPTVPTIHTTIPQVNGEFYRCQIRYQHKAAFEPVIFRSHTLTVQTQRIR